MVFGQILKNVIDKNQSVWIPTVGLLGYDKVTSKLGLDVYGAGSDSDLIHLISEIKQVSANEARGILIQEIESLKATISKQGKFSIEGLGDLSFSNGSYQFESKKTLFPTDFFGGGNFNPAAFKDNAPKEEPKVFENTFIKVETPKNPEPLQEIQLENTIEKPTVHEPVEQPKDLFEAANLEKNKNESSKSFLDSVKDFFNTTTEKAEEKLDHAVEEIKETSEEIIEAVDEKLGNMVEGVTPDLAIMEEKEISEEDFTSKILNEISEEEQDEELEELEEIEANEETEEEEEEEETEHFIESSTINEEFAKSKMIEIDEPRRNIGNARYDDGYYQYDLSLDEQKPNRWPLVAGLSLAFLAAGFLLAWIIASFQGKQLMGLNPLWDSKKPTVKKSEPALVAKADTAKIDTAKAIASAAVDTVINEVITKVQTSTPDKTTAKNNTTPAQPITKAASPAPAATSKPTSTQTAQITTKNTPTPKTPNSSDLVSKKSVAVATDKSKKTEDKASAKDAASISTTKDDKTAANKESKAKDTASKKTLAKVEKVNIIGKPYATANYTKGNHYLSFGKFKIASAAVKLKTDMKKKAGIETDIILLDGTYRVVVPYLSKEKAEAASKDYVSTTLFE